MRQLGFCKFALLLAALTSSCQAGVTVLDETSCRGPRPVIEDCTRGAIWAECGGTEGEPVFACSGVCYWFENGCVAEGYTASTCPNEDLCCIEDYPFGEEWHDHAHVQTYISLYAWGTHPWDRTRDRNVAVTLTSLTAAPFAVECTGVADMRGPCGSAAELPRRSENGVFTAELRSPSVAILYWTLAIEVTRDDDDRLHARVCRIESTDFSTYTCSTDSPACAIAGTLALSAFPEDATAAAAVRMDLSVTFADGATIDAQL